MEQPDFLPHSLDSEKALLSSIMSSPAKVIDLCNQRGLDETWYYNEDYAKVHINLLRMHKEGRPIELITATDFFSSHYKEIGLATPNIHALLTEIYTFTPTGSNALYYIQVLQEKCAARRGILGAIQAQKDLRTASTLDDVFLATSQAFTKCHEVCVVNEEDKDYDQKAMASFLDLMEDAATGKYKPDFFPTSFDTIDREKGGLMRGELMLIRALKGCGKSVMGQAIMQHNLFHRAAKASMYTFEMPYNQMLRRMVASRGRISLTRMRHATYNAGDLKNFGRSMSEIMATNLHVYDVDRIGRPTPSKIFSSIRKRAKNEGLDLAVIDHLGLVKFESTGKKNDIRHDEHLHAFSSEFKQLCLELKIVGVLLAQENAEGGTFGGSQVETDVDFSVCLNPVYKTISNKKRVVGTDSWVCDKDREGPLLGWKVPLKLEGEYASMRECEPEKQEAAF